MIAAIGRAEWALHQRATLAMTIHEEIAVFGGARSHDCCVTASGSPRRPGAPGR
ncbi:hypothetical protein [Amycolatopsis magusensis]|uniref:hypothetical protein n=1 Tax=Amycolatopsis magusensis TaxID=882444 RepID=UPI0037A5581D